MISFQYSLSDVTQIEIKVLNYGSRLYLYTAEHMDSTKQTSFKFQGVCIWDNK